MRAEIFLVKVLASFWVLDDSFFAEDNNLHLKVYDLQSRFPPLSLARVPGHEKVFSILFRLFFSLTCSSRKRPLILGSIT